MKWKIQTVRLFLSSENNILQCCERDFYHLAWFQYSFPIICLIHSPKMVKHSKLMNNIIILWFWFLAEVLVIYLSLTFLLFWFSAKSVLSWWDSEKVTSTQGLRQYCCQNISITSVLPDFSFILADDIQNKNYEIARTKLSKGQRKLSSTWKNTFFEMEAFSGKIYFDFRLVGGSFSAILKIF